MVTRILLVQPKPEADPEVVLATIQRLHQLRQHWPGIIDITTGATTSPEYPYGAVLRFVRPYLSIRVVNAPEYREMINELEGLAAVLSFDIENAEKGYPDEAGSVTPIPAYGLFAPTVEEQLRALVYLWFQGTGQSLTDNTVVADLLQADDFGLSLLEFSRALEQQFGIKDALDTLWDDKVTFGILLRRLETKLPGTKKGRQT